MYDWEIQNYLQERNNIISHKEYLHICNTCPQIAHIKYDTFNDIYEMWSDCNYFKFKVYLETK